MPDRSYNSAALALLAALLTIYAPAAAQEGFIDPRLPSAEQTLAAESSLTLGLPEAEPPELADLIGRLGAAAWSVREAAAARIAELGPGNFPTLARVYRQDPDYEVRLRILEIVRNGYLWQTLLRHKGYLGVAFEVATFTVPGPVQGGGEKAAQIIIQSVQAGSPAEQAGLRPGDLIVGLDGQPLGAELDKESFRDLITARGAGTEIVLDVVRGGQAVRTSVRLGSRPLEQYLDAELLLELNHQLQAFTVWWDRYFAIPPAPRERIPSRAVFPVPE